MKLIQPNWPVPQNVKAVITTRHGGVSEGRYSQLNLATHVGDKQSDVEQNRRLLSSSLSKSTAPSDIDNPPTFYWLNQTHSTDIYRLRSEQHLDLHRNSPPRALADADASITDIPFLACCILTADCLPVLICDQYGTQVCAVHAGWRGLADGILANAVAEFSEPEKLLVYLGPAISQAHFQVGEDVLQRFIDAEAARIYAESPLLSFKREKNGAAGGPVKYKADLYRLAKSELKGLGVQRIYGGNYCTFTDSQRFYSYRREGVCGRFASAIWLT